MRDDRMLLLCRRIPDAFFDYTVIVSICCENEVCKRFWQKKRDLDLL